MNSVAEQARKEVEAERFRAAVEVEKAHLRMHRRSLWARIFPFTIKIERKK
jgi:hypothetical protein